VSQISGNILTLPLSSSPVWHISANQPEMPVARKGYYCWYCIHV